MPRVGSSKNSTRASVSSHLATTTFCWLPPDSVCTGVRSDGARMSSCSARFSRGLVLGPPVDPGGLPGHVRQRDVGLDAQLQRQPLALAVLGHVADAGVDGVPRRVDLQLLAVQLDRAARRSGRRRRRRAPARCARRRRSRRSPGSRPLRTSNEQSRSTPWRVDALHPQQHVALLGVGLAGRGSRYSRPTISFTSSRSSMRSFSSVSDDLAVAHDGHAVGDLGDLVEPVRDVEDGDPVLLEVLR